MKTYIIMNLLLLAIYSIKSLLSEKEKQRNLNATKYFLSNCIYFFYGYKISFHYNKYSLIFSNIKLLPPNSINLTYAVPKDGYDLLVHEAKFTISSNLKIEIKNRNKYIYEQDIFFEIIRNRIEVKIKNDQIEMGFGKISVDFIKTKTIMDNLDYFKNFKENGRTNHVDFIYDGNIEETRNNMITINALRDYSSRLLSTEKDFLRKHINILTYDLKIIIKKLKISYTSENSYFKSFSLQNYFINKKNLVLYNNHSIFLKEAEGNGKFILNDIFYNFTFIIFDSLFFADLNLIKNKTFNFSFNVPWEHCVFKSSCFENNNTVKEKFLEFIKNDYQKYINDSIIQYYNDIFWSQLK